VTRATADPARDSYNGSGRASTPSPRSRPETVRTNSTASTVVAAAACWSAPRR